jgi:carotenoid cleavage dioxygenase-like enzyme
METTSNTTVNVKNFSSSTLGEFEAAIEIIKENWHWPEHLFGYVFIVAPYHRKNDLHLFAGEGVITRWSLKPQNNKIQVYSQKLNTWDSFWRFVLPIFNLSKGVFPAVISPLGVSEIANTAIVKLEKKEGGEVKETRLILTADAGRYWEVDPVSLETLTPVGYFAQHVIAVPLMFFPVLENTAHPFYDKDKQEIITCELKIALTLGRILRDLESSVYIVRWDSKKELQKWKLKGTKFDGSPHTVMVTEEYVMIPDMPFQMGVGKLLGLKIPPQKTYPKTQIYLVNRRDLKTEEKAVPSRLITFEGDSYHFLCNYHHIDEKIYLVAIQQATISLTEAIEKNDVKHFSGENYSLEYYGIPWMFAFDPGVLRKLVIRDAQLISEQAFIHPGWFSTTLYTVDPREFEQGYTAIYQIYVGYHRDLICRRQYIDFRDHENRILQDAELPQHNLPSVLAQVPLEKNWRELTEQIEKENNETNTHVSHLGKDLLDFYVCPEGYVLNSIQFIPQDKGYIFATVLTPTLNLSEAWLFAAENLKDGPLAKLCLPKDVHFGFTLHSEYFEQVNSSPRPSPSQVNRLLSACQSLLIVPWKFFSEWRN